jgi:hypothetical protein
MTFYEYQELMTRLRDALRVAQDFNKMRPSSTVIMIMNLSRMWKNENFISILSQQKLKKELQIK